jgi:serine phosphatase RsbU (regulator of sigma subunit)/ligand-binding sensor domain-containing protein
MKINVLVAILIAVIQFTNIYGQIDRLRFKQLNIEDGLSQSRISEIVQDSKGFIWVGTEDGLNRYDGYEFRIFTFDPTDSNSIANNVIRSLAAGDSGNLWIGTSFGGLNKYDAKTGKFISFRHDPNDPLSISSDRVDDIYRDKDGNLWLATSGSGFDYFDTKTYKFTRHVHDPQNQNSVSSSQVLFIYKDSRGSVWLGTDNGLDRFYPATNTFRQYQYSPTDPDGLNSPYLASIHEDRQGKIWFGTAGGGLNRFDPQTETFSHIFLGPNGEDNRKNWVSAIYEDQSGILWVGTWGGGLVQIDRHSNININFRNNPNDITTLSQDFITEIFEDLTGEIWIGSDLNGLSKVDRSASKFKTISALSHNSTRVTISQVRSFWEDDNGYLWLGSEGGLDRIDRRKNSLKRYRPIPGNPNSLVGDHVRSIYQDQSGILWLGTNQGLTRFDPENEKFTQIYVNPDDPEDPVNFLNYRIIELSNMPGVIWFGSNGGGICRYNIISGELKQYRHEGQDLATKQLNFSRTLYHSKKDPNIIWVGAFGGLTRFNIEEESLKGYVNDPNNLNSLSSNNIMGFYELETGKLLIATYGGGINYFDPETENFDVLTTNNSDLPSNSVYGFLPDNNGFLWISSNRGISKFDPKNKTFKNYTVEDGLQSDEFNGGAYYQSKSGEMFFGGINGINAFYPESISDNVHKPQIELTDFKLFNQSIDIGAESPLRRHISSTDEITLTYWQNDIEIEFVALHFYRSNNNNYAYKLDNYDEDWRFVGTARSAVYTNLDPGDYIFRVKASNSDGVWNENGPVLRITITPPWWSTTWAYIAYGLVFGLAIFAVDRIQRFRLTQRERNRSMIREAELRAKAAEDENQRKSHEMEEARRLQLSLLPEKLPELPNLEIAVYMNTATEVGGDYYDFNISADGTLNIALGDATGHGMQAGTVVTLMKGLFSADSGRMDIGDFFKQSSETIKDLRFGRMMMSFTMIKIKDKDMLFSSAGMPPAYIFRSSTMKVDELSLEGMPLGAMKEFKYQVIKEQLASGDTLLLMSDGLPELKNPDKEIFDYPRVEQVFRDVAGKTPQTIVDRLVDAGELWRKDQVADDDVTLMVIKAR